MLVEQRLPLTRPWNRCKLTVWVQKTAALLQAWLCLFIDVFHPCTDSDWPPQMCSYGSRPLHVDSITMKIQGIKTSLSLCLPGLCTVIVSLENPIFLFAAMIFLLSAVCMTQDKLLKGWSDCMQLHPTPLFPHLCFFIISFHQTLFGDSVWFYYLLTFSLSGWSCLFCAHVYSVCKRGLLQNLLQRRKKKNPSLLCADTVCLYRGVCVCMCVSSQKRDVVVLVCLSAHTHMSFCFHERSKACAPVSPECAMGPTFCLLTHISQSLGDSNCATVGEEEMLNNWEIKCLKRLYCDKTPPANSISHSALCLPRCPSLVIAELGSALHQQRPINYTRLQDQISPKPC